jgi:hypothetical protein
MMKKFKDEILYGISLDGRKPSMWDEDLPEVEKTNTDLRLLYDSCEIIKKNVTYELVEKLR